MTCNFVCVSFFFFNDTATTEIYTLSLHDALPISRPGVDLAPRLRPRARCTRARPAADPCREPDRQAPVQVRRRPRNVERSEEHTSELQSRQYLVCRLLLEKKNKTATNRTTRRSSH